MPQLINGRRISRTRTPSRLPEWGDMQGLMLSSYPHMDQAAYRLFRVTDRAGAKRWLERIHDQITPAFKSIATLNPPTGRHVNVAFTWTGIQELLEDSESQDPESHFPAVFTEGIAGRDHRSRILGDTGNSDPGLWEWGGPKNERVDVLLMVFAKAGDSIDSALRTLSPGGGVMQLVQTLHARPLSQAAGHEHFGFKDGISQPILKGSADAERFPESRHLTALGEFALGYPDEQGRVLGGEDATGRHLPLPELRGSAEFGRNGTYLVLRQLAQHVARFWIAVDEKSRANGRSDPEAAEELAAKIVGRRRDGTPLVPYATVDDNEFGFGDDPYGYGCPIGAHIRRANPRDALDNNNMPLVLKNEHRLLRRGRSYGEPLEDVRYDDGKERGLLFMCLNADLERQFEFIQQNWINNPAFAGLCNERDPLIGDHPGECPGEFTVDAEPAANRVHGLRRFVTVKGGQYFFLPGLEALKWMAQ